MTPDINKWLSNNPVNCNRGAPMGDADFTDSKSPLYLQRVILSGDYDRSGTYWGGGTPLWCAFNGDDDTFSAFNGTRVYVRAPTRKDAKQALLKNYSGLKFKK